jgi:putative ABC transport system permease protein
MKLWQTMKVVWANINGNRMRSFLTMLGMIIGVASVIILVSLMQGFSNSIISSYTDMGLNNVNVTIKGRNGNIIVTEADMYKYAKENSNTVNGVVPNVSIQATLSKKGKKEEYATITGIDEYFIKRENKEIQSGHDISYSDVSIRQKVCIIGSYLNQKFFKGNAQIGDIIQLNGEVFTIVGVLAQKSDSTQWSTDNCCYLPYTTAMGLLGVRSVSTYTFYIKSSKLVPQETTKIQKYLFNIFNDSKAYKVTNLMEMLKSAEKQMSILTSVIAGIGGISLVVAGIGIMNIMLVSVSERTREIGIRKSLGAKYKDIMWQFVLEAGVTSTIGGILGIILGGIITLKAGELVDLKSSPNLRTILLSFGISVSIGIIFGYLPARKAAKLNPIDALRNE